MGKKLLLCVGLTVSLFTVAACGDSDDESNGESTSEQESTDQESTEQDGSEQAPEAPEPDLEGIPDVVAEVNDEEISKEEFVSTYEGQFQQMAQQAQMSGEEVDQDQLKQQTADGMVDTELLVQEADNRGFEASGDDVNETLEEIAQQNGMESAEDFKAALNEQGMEEEEITSQLEIQVKLDKLIADEAGDIEPTEQELQDLYDQAKEQQQQQSGEEGSEEGSGMPPFEEVKPQLEEQAKSEKESEAAQALISDLREDAEVTINL